MENEVEESKFEDAVWLSFCRRLNCNFASSSTQGENYIYNLILIHKETGEKIDLRNTLAFLNEDRLVILESNVNGIPEKLKKGIISNEYQIVGLWKDGEIRGFSFKSQSNIVFIKVDTKNISPNINEICLFNENDNYIINASALIGIINSANTIKEIVDFFIGINDNSDGLLSFSNGDVLFRMWQLTDHTINEGALDSRIVVSPYETVRYNMELFDRITDIYPFEVGEDFYNVHSWKVVENPQTDLTLISKAHLGSINIFSEVHKKIIYRELHFMLEDVDMQYHEHIKSFSEIVVNALNRNKKLILSNCEKNIIEINIVSKSVLDNNTKLWCQIQETKYFNKLVFNKNSSCQITLVAPKWEKIFTDNPAKTTLKFENALLLNLLEGFLFKDKSLLLEKIKQTDNEKRTSSVFETEIRYFIQPLLEFSVPKISSFKNVRKSIAKIIRELGLKPGVYRERDIVGIIRKFRNKIREGLVSTIALYNQDDLNIKLQNILSSTIFSTDIHQKRLTAILNKGSIQNDKLNEFREQTINLREEARVYKKILEYLIEENLVTKRGAKPLIPSEDIVNELVSYGKYILDF